MYGSRTLYPLATLRAKWRKCQQQVKVSPTLYESKALAALVSHSPGMVVAAGHAKVAAPAKNVHTCSVLVAPSRSASAPINGRPTVLPTPNTASKSDAVCLVYPRSSAEAGRKNIGMWNLRGGGEGGGEGRGSGEGGVRGKGGGWARERGGRESVVGERAWWARERGGRDVELYFARRKRGRAGEVR
jgi:hypothetical protein